MVDITLNYLNEEREKIWKRVTGLEGSIEELNKNIKVALDLAKSKISADEANAKNALVNATADAETAKNKSQEITALLKEINPIIDSYKTNKILLENSIKKAEKIAEKHDELMQTANAISAEQIKIQSIQSQVKTALENAQNSENQVKSLESNSTASFNKINDMLSKSKEVKTEISELYDEVFGYETDTGEHEEGLKGELDKAYKELSDNMKALSDNFIQLKKEKEEEFSNVISEAIKKHDAIVSEIKSHLPDGVAAGLAGAFHEKKETETQTMEKDYKKFDNLLKWMVLVAVLPFIVYIIWLFQGKHLDEIIKTIPNMTFAVLPLYAPLVWLGVHLNKKINLSKKLIEEYAYKEAISKAVTGISEQIKYLKNEESSQEIYENLIRLVISASADNPGKYITEYNKCDNPVVEMLSDPKKFEKLLKKTPGMLDAGLSLLNSYKEKKNKISVEKPVQQ